MNIDLRNDWDRAPDATKFSIEAAVNLGVPVDALAFYARWWQLETWLRQLVYLEFRAKWGIGWTDHLTPKRIDNPRFTAVGRLKDDHVKNAYMATPDATAVMSYVDVGVLFMLIDENWALFEPCLPTKNRWDGWVDELQEIRHRSAHCRRPHRDDLTRIELVLRNLETGAFRSLESHNVRGQMADLKADDPVVRGWIEKHHPDAHLVDHADHAYDMSIRFEWSKRPWATWKKREPVTGREGFFIHAVYHLRSGHTTPARLWASLDEPNSLVGHSLVYLLIDSPYGPEFTFAAVDGDEIVNDSIARATHGVLYARRGGEPPADWMNNWTDLAASLDHRVLVNSALNIASPDTKFAVFAAQ
jgi:Swt1-like HEPN